jgi:hypothetical protein
VLTKREILEKLFTATTKEERRELLKMSRELDNPVLKNRVIHGDCLEVLKTFPDNYFDSLITDPPAGISFMGKNWDNHKGGMLEWINWMSEVMAECLRVVKPGACGLVWSIPRTSHWTGMALELAGFRIIDIVHHVQGSGFPKGQDISKHIDELFGAEREIIGKGKHGKGSCSQGMNKKTGFRPYINGLPSENNNGEHDITAPSSPEAKQWDGWKTPALKPAVEGWWLVQKPISESSIARNILKHGVGGLNIEACRSGISEEDDIKSKNPHTINKVLYRRKESVNNAPYNPNTGRYPANLILSCGADCNGDDHAPDCPVSVIGEQSGIREVSGLAKTGAIGKCTKQDMFGVGKTTGKTHNDHGTAARYFKQLPFDPETVTSVYYQAKASTKDRSCNGAVDNVHPTVKSRHLMGYLIKLITHRTV